MKTGVGFAIGFGIGAGLATGTTILVMKRHENKRCNQELDEIRAYYRKKFKDLEKKNKENEPEVAENKPEKEEKKEEKLSQKVGLAEKNTVDAGRKSVEPSVTDYTKFAKLAKNYASSDRPVFEMPYEITEEEYDTEDRFDKEILTYYESDDIFADMNDRKTDYVPQDFGFENLQDFGFEGVKYLRNNKANKDFKIIYEGSLSYDEATGGVNLNDP